MLSVGLSRVYLGAHWVGDVLGGFLGGGLILLLLWRFYPTEHGSDSIPRPL